MFLEISEFNLLILSFSFSIVLVNSLLNFIKLFKSIFLSFVDFGLSCFLELVVNHLFLLDLAKKSLPGSIINADLIDTSLVDGLDWDEGNCVSNNA